MLQFSLLLTFRMFKKMVKIQIIFKIKNLTNTIVDTLKKRNRIEAFILQLNVLLQNISENI